MKPRTSAILAFLFAGLALAAQDLLPSAARPLVDGRVEAGEYSLSRSYAGMQLGLSLSVDGSTLYASLQSPAAGWLGLGFGSTRMDGAAIFIGHVKGSEATVLAQRGKGHSHVAAADVKALKSAVMEVGGKTVLELELRAADFVREGRLALILSYSRTDNIGIPHAARGGIEFKVGK